MMRASTVALVLLSGAHALRQKSMSSEESVLQLVEVDGDWTCNRLTARFLCKKNSHPADEDKLCIKKLCHDKHVSTCCDVVSHFMGHEEHAEFEEHVRQIEAAKTDAPTDMPTEEPAAEEPAVEDPVVEKPVVEETAAEKPAAEEPAAEQTVVEETSAEMPAAEVPAAEEPVVEETAAEEPAAEMPAAEEPDVEETAAEEPAAEEPVAEEPVVEETVAEEPAAEEPAAEEPVVEETAAEGPAAEEPAAEEPVEEETAAEEARQAEQRRIEAARRAEEVRRAEQSRRTEEARRVEEARAEEARKAEEAKKAGEARRAADEARRAQEARAAVAEAGRVADEKRRAEQRRAEEARQAEQRRIEAARCAEEVRRAEQSRRTEEARRVEEALPQCSQCGETQRNSDDTFCENCGVAVVVAQELGGEAAERRRVEPPLEPLLELLERRVISGATMGASPSRLACAKRLSVVGASPRAVAAAVSPSGSAHRATSPSFVCQIEGAAGAAVKAFLNGAAVVGQRLGTQAVKAARPLLPTADASEPSRGGAAQTGNSQSPAQRSRALRSPPRLLANGSETRRADADEGCSSTPLTLGAAPPLPSSWQATSFRRELFPIGTQAAPQTPAAPQPPVMPQPPLRPAPSRWRSTPYQRQPPRKAADNDVLDEILNGYLTSRGPPPLGTLFTDSSSEKVHLAASKDDQGDKSSGRETLWGYKITPTSYSMPLAPRRAWDERLPTPAPHLSSSSAPALGAAVTPSTSHAAVDGQPTSAVVPTGVYPSPHDLRAAALRAAERRAATAKGASESAALSHSAVSASTSVAGVATSPGQDSRLTIPEEGGGDRAACWRRQIEAIYIRKNPDKLGSISELLAKHQGQEALLYRRICKRYNLDDKKRYADDPKAWDEQEASAISSLLPFGAQAASVTATTHKSPFGGGLALLGVDKGDSVSIFATADAAADESQPPTPTLKKRPKQLLLEPLMDGESPSASSTAAPNSTATSRRAQVVIAGAAVAAKEPSADKEKASSQVGPGDDMLETLFGGNTSPTPNATSSIAPSLFTSSTAPIRLSVTTDSSSKTHGKSGSGDLAALFGKNDDKSNSSGAVGSVCRASGSGSGGGSSGIADVASLFSKGGVTSSGSLLQASSDSGPGVGHGALFTSSASRSAPSPFGGGLFGKKGEMPASAAPTPLFTDSSCSSSISSMFGSLESAVSGGGMLSSSGVGKTQTLQTLPLLFESPKVSGDGAGTADAKRSPSTPVASESKRPKTKVTNIPPAKEGEVPAKSEVKMDEAAPDVIKVETREDFWKVQIEAIYRRRNPKKMDAVAELMAKYKGKEPTLYRKICLAYDLDPKKLYADSASWTDEDNDVKKDDDESASNGATSTQAATFGGLSNLFSMAASTGGAIASASNGGFASSIGGLFSGSLFGASSSSAGNEVTTSPSLFSGSLFGASSASTSSSVKGDGSSTGMSASVLSGGLFAASPASSSSDSVANSASCSSGILGTTDNKGARDTKDSAEVATKLVADAAQTTSQDPTEGEASKVVKVETREDFWKVQVEAIYRRRNPRKLDSVPDLMQKYKGKEAVLYAKVCKQYDLDPKKLYADSAAWKDEDKDMKDDPDETSNGTGSNAPVLGSLSSLFGTPSDTGSKVSGGPQFIGNLFSSPSSEAVNATGSSMFAASSGSNIGAGLFGGSLFSSNAEPGSSSSLFTSGLFNSSTASASGGASRSTSSGASENLFGSTSSPFFFGSSGNSTGSLFGSPKASESTQGVATGNSGSAFAGLFGVGSSGETHDAVSALFGNDVSLGSEEKGRAAKRSMEDVDVPASETLSRPRADAETLAQRKILRAKTKRRSAVLPPEDIPAVLAQSKGEEEDEKQKAAEVHGAFQTARDSSRQKKQKAAEVE